MSTSLPGSDTTSQDAAYLRIQELERQLFVVNEEKRKAKLDFEVEKRKAKLDFEVEIVKLRDENEARKDEASYEIRKATNESDALKQKLATLNAQVAAKAKEHPEEDIASEGPVGSSESPLGDAGLQAEIEHLKAKKKRYLDEVLSLRKEVTEKDYRLYNAKVDLKEFRMYTKSLEEQNDILRTKHQATREFLNTSAENLTTSAEREIATSYNLAQSQQNFIKSLQAEFEDFHEVARQTQKVVASAKKVANFGWQEVHKATEENNDALLLPRTRLLKAFDDIIVLNGDALEAPSPPVPGAKHAKMPKTASAPKASPKETAEASVAPKAAETDRIGDKGVGEIEESSLPEQGRLKEGDGMSDVKIETPSTPNTPQSDKTKGKGKEKQKELTVNPGQPEYDPINDKGAEEPPSSMQERSNEGQVEEQSVEKEISKEDDGSQPKLGDVKSTASVAEPKTEAKGSWADDTTSEAGNTGTQEGPKPKPFPTRTSNFGQFQQANPAGFYTGGITVEVGDQFTLVPTKTSQKQQKEQRNVLKNTVNNNDAQENMFVSNNPYEKIRPGGMRPTSKYATFDLVEVPSQQDHTRTSSFFGDQSAKSTTSSIEKMSGSWSENRQPLHPAHTAKKWRRDEPVESATEPSVPPSSTATTTTSDPVKKSTPPPKSRYSHPSRSQKLKKLVFNDKAEADPSEALPEEGGDMHSPTSVTGEKSKWKLLGVSSEETTAKIPSGAASKSSIAGDSQGSPVGPLSPSDRVVIEGQAKADDADPKLKGNAFENIWDMDEQFQLEPKKKIPQSRTPRRKLEAMMSGGLVSPTPIPYNAQRAGQKTRSDVVYLPPSLPTRSPTIAPSELSAIGEQTTDHSDDLMVKENDPDEGIVLDVTGSDRAPSPESD